MFWPPSSQNGPLHVHTGRVGNLDEIERYTADTFGANCLRLGRSIELEKRVGIPDNAEQESVEAHGLDDPYFPPVEAAPDGTEPRPSDNVRSQDEQPYLIARVFCPEPIALLQLLRWAFVPPLIVLIIVIGVLTALKGRKGHS